MIKTSGKLNGRARSKNYSMALQIMALSGIVCLILFNYLPMFGIFIAFQDYTLAGGFLDSPFVGLHHFRTFLNDPIFFRAVRNTLIITGLTIAIGFPLPILLALILNELPFRRFRTAVQTVSYFPHFIAYVVVAGLWLNLLDTRGLVNNFLMSWELIDRPIFFWAEVHWYRPLVILVHVWKETGWGAIIYVAAIAGINPELYEAAKIDGASRLRQIRHVTLPGIAGTIVVMLILAMGGLVRGNLDQSMLFGNVFNRSVSYIIEHYVLDLGFGTMRYSFAAAIGLMQSIFALILVLGANRLARVVSGRSII